MNTKQSMLVCNVNFNDVTALVKDEKDNLICFLWKVSSLEMKFSLRVSMPLTPSISCMFLFFGKWAFIFKQKSAWDFASCCVYFFFWKSSVKEEKKKWKVDFTGYYFVRDPWHFKAQGSKSYLLFLCQLIYSHNCILLSSYF